MAGFISEWWPASFRYGGRHQIGIGGRIASECLRVQIGPAAQSLPRGRMRDLFEAGLNEAAALLAAAYGRSVAVGVEQRRSPWAARAMSELSEERFGRLRREDGMSRRFVRR